MSKLDITSQQRRALKSAAHSLKPVVKIGDKGLTESVLKEINLNLNAHELIKVHVAEEDKYDRNQILETICEQLNCAPISHMGRMLVLYRPDPKKQESESTTRAERKPSQPYIPKQLAAQGINKKPRNYGKPSAGKRTTRT